MNMDTVIQPIYLLSAILFILSLMWMSHPSTARRGIIAGVVAMLAAIGGTLLLPEISTRTWIWVAIALGTVIGIPLAMVPLCPFPDESDTVVPVPSLNEYAATRLGGSARVVALVTAEYWLRFPAASVARTR